MLKLKFENGMALVKNEYNIRRILGAALKRSHTSGWNKEYADDRTAKCVLCFRL